MLPQEVQGKIDHHHRRRNSNDEKYNEISNDGNYNHVCNINNLRLTPREGNRTGSFYLPGTPWRTALASEEDLNNATEIRLQMKGRVFGNDCIPMSNILVEPFYNGIQTRPRYPYRRETYRGRLLTNACGEYEFISTFPHPYEHLHRDNNHSTTLEELYPTRHIHFHFSYYHNETTPEGLAEQKLIHDDGGLLYPLDVLQTELISNFNMVFEGFIPKPILEDESETIELRTAKLIKEADGSFMAYWNVYLNVSGTSTKSDHCPGISYGYGNQQQQHQDGMVDTTPTVNQKGVHRSDDDSLSFWLVVFVVAAIFLMVAVKRLMLKLNSGNSFMEEDKATSREERGQHEEEKQRDNNAKCKDINDDETEYLCPSA